MTDYPAVPSASPERLSFFNVMLKAITGPSTRNFRSLARNPEASAGKAYLWVAVAAVISSIMSTLVGLIFPSNPMLDSLYRYGGDLGMNFDFAPRADMLGSLAFSLLCGVPLAAIIAVIGFAIISGLFHLIAGMLGGKGDYGQMAFLLAAVSVPFTLITGLLSSIPYLGCIVALLSLYVFVLEVLAIDGVYQFGVGKALITLLIPLFAVFLLAACIAIGIVALLVPVLRESTLYVPLLWFI